MSRAWAQINGDDVGATHTVGSTNFEIFPGSTVWTNLSGGYEFMKPVSTGAAGLRFIIGNEGKGTWKFNAAISYTASVGNKIYHTALFKNSTKIQQGSVERKIATAGDVGAVPICAGGVVLKNSTDIVDFRIESTGSTNAQLTINHLTIYAERVSTSTAVG